MNILGELDFHTFWIYLTQHARTATNANTLS